MKKILIIGPPSLGYLEKINQHLEVIPSVKSHIILIDKFTFKYKNKWQRIKNMFSKLFFNTNIKVEFLNRTILNQIHTLGSQDLVFIIRPDLLKVETLKTIKLQTQQMVAFFYDSIRRFPEKANIISLFDKVYSYDKIDVKKYDLSFLTNYIYDESDTKDYETLFFNISTYDYRFYQMENLARYIDEHSWRKEILILAPSDIKSQYVTIINSQIKIDDVTHKIKKSKIIVEIQRSEQIGLSFRVFEALGHRKKLITTNRDIINYDFYHPQNILVIDIDDISISESFVNTPYVDIEDKILNKYRLKNWIKPIFLN